MKTAERRFAIIVALVVGFAAFAEDDHWTYDSAVGTISDGVWTFSATVSGTSLTVNAVTGYPETRSVLDFAKPVRDAGWNNYVIVKLNPHFAHKKANTDGGYRPGDLEASEASTKVGELILPQTGLTAINAAAFAYCSNLTNIVNYLPDSVSSIGNSAFAHCPAKQDLFVRGISGGTGRGIFYGAGIRSITFGRRFKTIGDTSNGMGSFQNCASVTNIVFDPESSNINLPVNAFRDALTLKQPLVLYGVTNLNSSAFSNCKVSSITFDKGIKYIGTLSGVSGLTEVHFLGTPPTSQSGKWADYGQGTDKTVTTYVPSKFLVQWKPYAAGGEIRKKSSTFSSAYATEPAKRPLLYEGKIQFKISLK